MDGFESFPDPVGHLGFAEFGHTLEASIVLDRHYTRNDRALNACTMSDDALKRVVLDTDSARPLNEVKEDLHVVEELRDNEVCACVDLLLEVLEVLHRIIGLAVSFGVGGDAHTELRAELGANEAHHVDSVSKTLIASLTALDAPGGIYVELSVGCGLGRPM